MGIGEEDAKLAAKLAPLKNRLSKESAYLGVLVGFSVFIIALFFTWTRARLGITTTDSGQLSGWSEAGYLAGLPLSLIVYKVVKNQPFPLKPTILVGALSLVILLTNNVVNRSTWTGVQYMGLVTPLGGKNLGSDVGGGLWIGLLAIVAVSISGIAWSLQTTGAQD